LSGTIVGGSVGVNVGEVGTKVGMALGCSDGVAVLTDRTLTEMELIEAKVSAVFTVAVVAILKLTDEAARLVANGEVPDVSLKAVLSWDVKVETNVLSEVIPSAVTVNV